MPYKSEEEKKKYQRQWAKNERENRKKRNGNTYSVTQLRRIENGECLDCGSDVVDGKRYCDEHRKFRIRQNLKYQEERMEKGLCRTCNNKPLPLIIHCFSCWCSQLSKRYKIPTTTLKDLWKESEKICPYFKVKLVPGLNASLDHIIPVSRGGPKSDKKNLQWVSQAANEMKGEWTHTEFMGLVNDIVEANK